MRIFARIPAFALFAVLLLTCAAAAAATKYSRNSGNWSTAGTWTTNPNCNAATGSGAPAAGDTVIICNGDAPVLNVNTASLASLTINNGGQLVVGNSTTARTITTAAMTTSGTGTLTFNTNAAHQLNISGALNNGGTITVNNTAVTTATPSITVGGLLTNTGNLTFAGGAALTWQANGGISNSGTISVNTASNVSHNLEVQGNFANTGTVNCLADTNSTCTLVFNGGSQTLSGAGTWSIYRLTLDNAAGLTLARSITVTSQVTLSNGRIATGANVLTVAASGNVTGANATRFIIGTLARGIAVSVGAQTLAWDVGVESPAVAWAPVTLAFPSVGTAGTITVTTTNGAHPNLGSSSLSATLRADRYWTLTNAATVYPYVGATLGFVAGDVINGATATNFIAGKFSGGGWLYPNYGTRTATSMPTTEILFSEGLGSFALGEWTGALPAAYSEFRFEQAAYAGTAGEVIDNGTGLQHGQSARLSGAHVSTANTTPAIAGDPGSCRYGVFNRATKQYVALPASYPNLGASSSFTVSAWIRTTDPALGAQRVMIDDEEIGPGTALGWGVSVGEGGTGTLRFYSRGAASQVTTDTGNVIAANTWYFIAAVMNLAQKTKRVYVFSAAGVLLGTNQATWTEGSWGFDAGITTIGGESNAATENPNVNSFSGNLDYVRVHQSALPMAQLQELRQQNHYCFIPAHYSISFPAGATGVTCDPHQVTITAHDAAEALVAPSAGLAIGLNTSTGLGVWQTVGGLNLGGGVDNGQGAVAWPGGASSMTVQLRHTTVVGALSVNLLDSEGKAEAAGVPHDPPLAFQIAAFRVSNGSNAPLSIGTHLAGKPSGSAGWGSQNLFLQAIRTDTNTGACTAIFPNPTEVDIQVGATCNNPATCSQNVTLTTTATSGTPTGNFVPNGAYPATVRFRFSAANAQAPFGFSYADAGRISLQFQYPFPTPPGTTHIQGASNTFVVRPYGLAITGVTTSGSPLHTDAAPYVAGSDFNVTLTAVQWKSGDDADNNGVPDSAAQIAGNAPTQNFGKESSAATATVTHTLNAPATGAAGALAGGTFNSFGVGVGNGPGAQTKALSWSEVGFLNLLATSSNYLGSGQNVTNAAAGLTGVGRFKPDRFVLTGAGTLAAGCSTGTAFSYLGQAFAINGIQMEARNAANAVTTNYRGNYARFNPAVIGNFNLGARALDGGGTALTARIDPGAGASGSWGASSGVLTASLATLAIARASPDTTLERFAQARFGIAPTDPDGVALHGSALDLDADGAGGAERQQLVGAGAAGNVDLRYGRLRVLSASGSPLLPLRVPVRAEYWNGTAFAQNADDGCTVINRNTVALTFTGANLAACQTAVNAASVTLAGGAAKLVLAAPGAGKNGSVVVSPQVGTTAVGNHCPSVGGTASGALPAGMSWLRGRWSDSADPDSLGTTSYDDPPSARASFGTYGAQPRNWVFFRENY